MATRTYDYNELKFKLNPKDLKPLFQIKPLRHAWAMFYNWAIIIGCIVLWAQFPSVWLYILAVIVIGARMHALAILMHDATHYRFMKNRKWNDLLSNIFTMYPIFTSIEKYRRNHLAHHQELNTDEDPDWVAKLGKRSFTFPQSRAQFLLMLSSYLILYQGIMDMMWFLKRFGSDVSKRAKKEEPILIKIAFYLVLFSALTFLGWWKYFLMFWIVPWLSTFFMFQYIRSVSEHFGNLTYDNLLTSTRTVKTNFIERFIIAPHHVGYHLEHHLYPGVPFYNLPKLHDLLMERADYQEKAHITIGYMTGLFDELCKNEVRTAAA
ncbi:MAG: fatty acid desaturase family protein [Bacteroidota bacterium]